MGRPCVHCGEIATTVVIEVGPIEALLDLCERHLADLLLGSRRVPEAGLAPWSVPWPGPPSRPKRTHGRSERLAP